jgi:hypothetical protein
VPEVQSCLLRFGGNARLGGAVTYVGAARYDGPMPYTYPKLAVAAVVSEQNFAEVLERRLKRIAELEATPINASKPEIEVKSPMPRLADRRYRRV